MSSAGKPVILCIDDTQDILKFTERLLTRRGYSVITAKSGAEGLKIITETKPNLILLDVMMPEMDGYNVCSILQRNEETAYIPVIFITALGDEQDRTKAFSVGAVDYIVKPIQKENLLHKVRTHLKTDIRWKRLQKDALKEDGRVLPYDFIQFKEFLFDQLGLNAEKKFKFSNIPSSKIYSFYTDMGTSQSKIAQYIAKFLSLSYISHINPEKVELGVLPTPFCRKSHVVAVNDGSAKRAFVLSNPFDWDLMENLKKLTGLGTTSKLIVSEPANIELLLRYETATLDKDVSVVEYRQNITKSALDENGQNITKPDLDENGQNITKPDLDENGQNITNSTLYTLKKLTESEAKEQSVLNIYNKILNKAVSERASDIHIEPKENKMVIRFRIDGDLRTTLSLKKDTGVKLISRFKVFGGLNIAEKRKPQDGSFRIIIDDKIFSIRLATTSTANGESIVIRLLHSDVNPKELQDLGLMDKQANTMIGMIKRTEGVIMIVGPTGSGKSTTIFSMIHKMDCLTRSLMSVEDPIEYRIPLANQQEVNEKAGVTFEAILKSTVRQDPDILFLGEIRDQTSAKIAMDFASTGHLTVTSMHASNATSAVFRLERLGIDRGIMADTMLGVIAQRLMKKLCPDCKKIVSISQEEIDMLSQFTDAVPAKVAHPVGCLKCNNTGYHGREAISEILEFDAEISQMVRSNIHVSEIRSFAQKRGDYLISDHAIEKVRSLIFTPQDVYEEVLVKEARLEQTKPEKIAVTTDPRATKTAEGNSILIVDDDGDTRKLITHILKNRGFRVSISKDGIDALISLTQRHFDLILSDINMPNLDGFKLLDVINQKGIKTPVIFLTSNDSSKYIKKGLELGAIDYINKPIQKEILALRVNSALQSHCKPVDL